MGVLITTRTTCAWGTLGHTIAAYDAALTYSKQRQQFGKPLCSFQIVKDRLVKMLAEVTDMQLHCVQLAHRCGSDAPGAVSVLTFESLLVRIWVEAMVPWR